MAIIKESKFIKKLKNKMGNIKSRTDLILRNVKK